jgi:hypothetical protein
MRILPLMLLPCALLSLKASAADEPITYDRERQMRAACPDLRSAEWVRCMHMQLAMGTPCTGTVEQRLICLEDRIAKQARDIVRLKYELHNLNTPRVQQLESRNLTVR